MSMSFSNRELPDIPVKLNGKIKTAINRYIKRKVPMRAFMTDFLAVKSKSDALADAVNPWAYNYKGIEGYEVESGVSVEESLFRFTTMELADCMPTDVINAAYYANKKRNDSDFEIGYLIPEFISFLKPDLNVLAVNPSPDMIIALEKDYCEGRRFYAVTDETIAALYRIQFPESCFITFSQFETIHNIGAILISNRDLKIENAPLLLESLSCCNKEAFIMALVPSAWFDNVKSGAYRSIAAVNWGIRDLLIVDTNATVSTPRKKILVFINQGNSQTINIKQSNYNPSNRLFTVLDESLCINALEYMETQKTILSFWKQNDRSSDEEPKPRYRKAKEYCFSKEISLFYKIYSDRKNRYAGIVYYREIGKDPNAWGRKLSGDVEKGLRADSREKIIQALEGIIFEDAIYLIVRTDLEKKYIRNRSAISLKTIWFYCWAYLRELQKYDHQFICGIMRDRDIGDYMPVSHQGAELLELIAKNHSVSPEDIPYKTVEQFNMIFSYAVRHGLLVHNPLEVYMREYSNRASERQQDVRNALVKKHFSAEEEKAIFIAITEDREVNEKILPNCCANGLLLATAIRMFTGMAIREVAALLWEDYRHVDTSCSYHFTITKFTDSKGKIILHAERENWKRFRIVPVATVLSRLLEQRWHYLIELGIDEDYLLSCPIVLQEEQIANMKKKCGGSRDCCCC